MDRKLLIDLNIDPFCNIRAIDHSDYLSLENDVLNHVALEFLTNKDSNIIHQKVEELNINREDYRQELLTIFSTPSDGTFTYYKLIVPQILHFAVYKNSQEIEKYAVADKYFFYDGKLYYSEIDVVSLNDKHVFQEITNLFDLWNNKDEQGLFWFSSNVFSICRLEKCLISLQRKTIENCITNKCKDVINNKDKRDFILDSVFVLKYLTTKNNCAEAQRILDNLSSCGNLCEDEFDSILAGGCNCGSAV